MVLNIPLILIHINSNSTFSKETIQKLQDELRVAQHDKQTSDAISKSYMEEVASYKRLSESLKQKIREMSKGSNIDIDSFEEVMKEEMMAMKEAFTAKLK